VVGFEELFRGRIAKAHEAAEELMAVGRRMNDPRSIGLGMAVRAWIAMGNEDYAAALDFAETSIAMACTPLDRETGMNAKVNALVLLRRPEAEPMLRDLRDRCTANGWLYALSTTDTTWGVTLVLQGEIGAGIRWIERAILAREREGYPDMAGVYRIYLCEIYLEIITGMEKPPIKVLMRNFFTLAVIMVTAEKRIRGLVERVRQNPRFDPNGHHIGHCEMILGLLHKAKKKRALAVRHLTEARRIISQSGSTPALARIDAALAELR
jgi:hypothetical protein